MMALPLTSSMYVCSRCRHHLVLMSLGQTRGVATGSRFTQAQGQSQPQTHYQVLGVKNDASSADIKAAYFQLSKELHPDANPENPDQHDLFVQLSEAYGVLGKPTSRKDYDLSLLRPHNVTEIRINNADVSPDNPFGGHRKADWFPKTHIFREGREEQGHENYYGIRGVQRVQNHYVVYGCVLFIITGAVFHFFVFRQSSQYATNRLDEKDRKLAAMYNQAKETARINGTKKQLELLRERHDKFRLKLKNMGSEV